MHAPRISKTHALVVLVAGAALVFAGLAYGSTASRSSAAKYPGATNPTFKPPNLHGQSFHVFFGSSVNTSKVPILHAIALLAKWGATTKIDYVDSNQIGIGALLQGQADAEVDGIDGGVAAFKAAQGIVAIALSQPRLDYGLICQKNITSVTQLQKGVTIGVVDSTGTTPLMGLIAAKRAGIGEGDVRLIITGGQSSRAAALIGGRTDCTVLGTTNLQSLEAQGFHTVYSYIKNSPGLWGDIVWSTPAWVKAHRTMAIALNEALLLSYRWVDSPANKNAFVQEALLGTLYDLYVSQHLVPPNSVLTKAGLSYNQAVFRDFGLMDSILPPSQFANTTVAAQALKNVGMVKPKGKH
jgi:ABC-type nitrate/sulfonate/bicarbonate transport system substrate-binding protein